MKLTTVEVAGFTAALYGMRNPKNSWDKGDSEFTGPTLDIGANDLELAHTLLDGGRVHCKFMRQIMVWVDIEAPLYWWAEFDTYKVGVVRDSCSTMHTLVSTMERMKDDPEINEWLCRTSAESVEAYPPKAVIDLFEVHPSDSLSVIAVSNAFRMLMKVLDTDEPKVEKLRTMKKILPDSWIQRSMISMSYQNVRDMLTYRRTHRLPEWNTSFVNWASTLPAAEQLLFYNLGEGK